MKTFLFIFFLSLHVQANYIGIENNFRHIGMIQTDDQGSTNFLEYAPGVVLSSSIANPFFQNIWLYPAFTIFFPQRSEDELYRKWSAELNLHLLKPINQSLDVTFGFTYLMDLIIGAGGTSTQNNGNSSSTYYVPKHSRFIGGFAPEFGFRYEFWQKKYLYMGLISHQILREDSRSYTLSIQLLTWI